MRLPIVLAALAAFSVPALAQQGKPQPQQQRPPAETQQAPAPAPGMFACRTESETCFIAIVVGKTQVSVLYTNDPSAEGVEAQPVAVQSGAGAAVDLGQHLGRVVMITGRYAAPTGLTGAEVVDVASPLLSFAIKSMLAGGTEEEAEPEPEPEPVKPQPRQQPRR